MQSYILYVAPFFATVIRIIIKMFLFYFCVNKSIPMDITCFELCSTIFW